MNVTVVGSCLSAIVSSRLVESKGRGFAFFEKFEQLRTDVVLSILDGSWQGYDNSNIDRLHQIFCKNMPELKRKQVLNRFRSQANDKISGFVEAISDSDIVVFDNNYDLSGKVYNLSVDGESFIFSNLHVPDSDGVTISPLLHDEEAFLYQTRLLKRLLTINPKVQIFVINYPVTAFENRNNPSDLLRVERARLENQFMKCAIEDGSVPEGVTFIGCLDLPDRLLSEKGPLYFEEEVYKTFSDLIDLKARNRIEQRYFDDYVDLKNKISTISHNNTFVQGDTPYSKLPNRQYWRPAVADPYPLAIADVYRKKFSIDLKDGVATCGSCFAQHIGKRLDRRGYSYLDVEPAPEGLARKDAGELGYGIYSARYGNVYTSRQLVQLFDRAFGNLEFDEVWPNNAGRYVDPFRPNLCGEGVEKPEDVLEEQRNHLGKVRHMFETLDVFVFTMGLTETWINRGTGAVYPICPGVTAGVFDPEKYEFVNLDYATILEEMESFFERLRAVNPSAKVLLTVSPVPLTATAEDRHVLISTMASKSILRSVADQLYRRHDHVDYFPSYDIIMSPPFRSMFFKNNLRNIHEEGVDFVMSHFFAEHQLNDGQVQERIAISGSQNKVAEASLNDEGGDDEAFCDEAFLELKRKSE